MGLRMADIPFKIGSVINIKNDDVDVKDAVILNSMVQVLGNDELSFEYQTNKGGWIKHSECILVEDFNFQKLKAAVYEEMGEPTLPGF